MFVIFILNNSMKRYFLKTKFGERIAVTEAYDLFEAQINFSQIKVLKIKDLLSLFLIEETLI